MKSIMKTLQSIFIFATLLTSTFVVQSAKVGSDKLKENQFKPRYHSDNPTEEASLLNHKESSKLSICNAYNLQLTEPKPFTAVCHVECDIFSSAVKCKLPERIVPECKDYAAYVFRQILTNFEVISKQNDFKCEVPTLKDHSDDIFPEIIVPLHEEIMKSSPFCDEYRKSTLKSSFEFPCYVKCDTFIVGLSMDNTILDWELKCELYQETCFPSLSTKPINMGNICEAYNRFVLSKVKLGESGYHHCDVFNHGPQFNYFNQTLN